MPSATLTATNIAFKEWAVVCDQVFGGQQVVLLRKGGILEQRGKGFQIEHEQFLLYPNTEHQSREQLKPQFHEQLAKYGPPARESGRITIAGFCRVVDIVKTADAEKLRALEPATCWTQALFDMRIKYKPEKPNFVVTVRAYRLPSSVDVPYHEDYAGCHSWVPLKQEVPLTGAVPVLSDDAFEAKRREVLRIVE
ncbi:MAG TPA: DUF1802 family protein [Planctomycetota bacterium]|nr:DUF1802 family protein [Planctomycetota bacterium]